MRVFCVFLAFYIALGALVERLRNGGFVSGKVEGRGQKLHHIFGEQLLGVFFILEVVDEDALICKKRAKEHYSKRELERQIGTSYYERSMISAKKPMPESVSHDVRESILDTYVLEFLDLPEQFSEKNLRKAIIENLKQFILEFGRDFTFIGEEYRVQVGNTDFFIDLLFYNRALSCLVPIELKIGKFKPEHIGQINFYLEALDRDVKKPNENPSVGVILCASKDDAVVEYALSRSMSPTLVADYRLCLPDKTLLQNKLRELTELALESGEGNEGDEE